MQRGQGGVYWQLGGGTGFQELSSCNHGLETRRRSAATEGLSSVTPPPASFSLMTVRKHGGNGFGVSRMLFSCYNTFSLSFHYHLVGRRLSSCFGTHSLHTVGESLNKNTFFIIGNYKTIITLCVVNVQRKKIVGIF